MSLDNWKTQLGSPAHSGFQDIIARLPSERFPDCADLNALAKGLVSGGGQALRFVGRPGAVAPAGESYEARIFHTGDVLTRHNDWHDLFNALAWLAFPCAKRELNRAHCKHALNSRTGRGTARDVLTLFDESGVLVACADRSLARLLAQFQWKTLFWERRAEVLQHMRFFVIGHALHQQCLKPYPGITGKALLFDYDAEFLRAPTAIQLAAVDARAAAWVRTPQALATTHSLAPLPLLGIPGWDVANNSAAYYENAAVFRPGRRAHADPAP